MYEKNVEISFLIWKMRYEKVYVPEVGQFHRKSFVVCNIDS
jgi:hypothetical protein